MIEEVIRYVREASRYMNNDEIAISQKGNESNYVTSADVAVQRYLTEKLVALLPGSFVHGEESDAEEEDRSAPMWIIDPIDGTSNFIRNIGCSVISVALYRDGQIVLGVIYHPYRDEMFHAVRGEGAYLNGKRIHVSERDFRHSHLCAAMSLYEKKYARTCFNIIEKVYFESDDLRRLGSAALELAYLAAGRIELFFEIRIFSWDVAAGILLVEEAGGFAKMYGHDSLYLDGPFPIYAANSSENMDRFEMIIFAEMPSAPY